ncbi:MAG: hypothetical protein KA604_02490 [Candidatus Saccharimonas sp.]|nr:hypothetical protein [Candidatus Saccharimonas sp.]
MENGLDFPRQITIKRENLTFTADPTQDIDTRQRTYRITDGDKYIGTVSITYDHSAKRCTIANITIADRERSKGYGIKIYSAVPFLPGPSGTSILDSGYTFESSVGHTIQAERVWRGLAKRGLASEVGSDATLSTHHYIYQL